MTSAGVAELKAKLSQYLAAVQAGDEVLITDRGRPVARLVAARGGPGSTDAEEDGRLDRMERAGVLRRPEAVIDESFWELRRARDRGATVRGALLEERESGR